MRIKKEETEEILYTIEGNFELLDLNCGSLRNDSRRNIPDVIRLIKKDMDKKGVTVFLDEFVIDDEEENQTIGYKLAGYVGWQSLPFDKKVIRSETFFRHKSGRIEYVLRKTVWDFEN